MEVILKVTEQLRGSFIELGRVIDQFYGSGATESLNLAKEITMSEESGVEFQVPFKLKEGVEAEELEVAFGAFGIDVIVEKNDQTQK